MDENKRPSNDEPEDVPADEVIDRQQVDEEQLSAYLDGELSSEQRAALESRLAKDESLQSTFTELQTLSRMMQSLPEETLPETFASDVLRRAERKMLVGQSPDSEPVLATGRGKVVVATKQEQASSSWRRWWWVPATLAATIVVAIFVPSLTTNQVAKVEPENTAPEEQASDAGKAELSGLDQSLSDRSDADRSAAAAVMAPESFEEMDADAVRMPESTEPQAAGAQRGHRASRSSSTGAPGGSAVVRSAREEDRNAAFADNESMLRDELPLEPLLDDLAADETQPEPGVWDYGLQSSLVEVRVPPESVSGLRNARQNRQPTDRIGQVLAVHGTRAELMQMIGDLSRHGAEVEVYDVPQQFQTQLLQPSLQRARFRQVRKSDSPPIEHFQNRAIQQTLLHPPADVQVYAPSDSQQLAQIASENVARGEAQQSQPQQWLVDAAQSVERRAQSVAEADAESAPPDAIANRTVDRMLKEFDDASSTPTQVYLWLRAKEDTEQPTSAEPTPRAEPESP